MTAAGMSMHMAMANARAASKHKVEEKPGADSIWLTEEEIREIREESAKQTIEQSGNIALTEKGIEDPNDNLPKCSYCCLIM